MMRAGLLSVALLALPQERAMQLLEQTHVSVIGMVENMPGYA